MNSKMMIEMAAVATSISHNELVMMRNLISSENFKGLEDIKSRYENADYQGHFPSWAKGLEKAIAKDCADWALAIEAVVKSPAYAKVVASMGVDAVKREISRYYYSPKEIEEVLVEKKREEAKQKELSKEMEVRSLAKLWCQVLGLKTMSTTEIWTDEESWGPSLDWGGDNVDSESLKKVLSVLRTGGDMATVLDASKIMEAEERMQYYFDREEAAKAFRESELVKAGVAKEEAKKLRDNEEQARLARWQVSSMRDVKAYADEVLNKGSRRGWICSTRTYQNLTDEAKEYLARVESIRQRWNDRKSRLQNQKSGQVMQVLSSGSWDVLSSLKIG